MGAKRLIAGSAMLCVLAVTADGRGMATAQTVQSSQAERSRVPDPPPLASGTGVVAHRNHVAWVYTSNSELAPKLLKAIAGAAETFTRHFDVAPPLVAVFDGPSVTTEQRNTLTTGGAAWVLALPVSQMVGQLGGEDTAFSTLAHEIGHGWFAKSLWGGTVRGTGAHYGGDAPDWLDEVAAILLEHRDQTFSRRTSLRQILASSETAALVKPLSELFSMKHPGLDPAQLAEIVKHMEEARARGEAASAINLRPDPKVREAMAAFYSQCRGVVDYLAQKSADPRVLRYISDALRSGKSMDEWLRVEGKQLGLPDSLPKLQVDWDVWLGTRG